MSDRRVGLAPSQRGLGSWWGRVSLTSAGYLLLAVFGGTVWLASDTPTTSSTDPEQILRASVSAMGGSAPATCDARGTIHIDEGGSSRDGTFEVLTKTAQETNDIIDADRHQEHIYNNESAADVDGTQKTPLSKERMLSAESMHLPLVLFQALLDDSDTAYQYIGSETVDGSSCDHIRVWDTFASQPDLEGLASNSTKDIWIDSWTHFPVKITTSRCVARGAVYKVPIEVDYSSFRDSSGVKYPSQIKTSRNGVAWTSVALNSLTIDGPVSDSSFDTE